MVYVLDTSVILSDPKVFERLLSKDLVIPLVVISELEVKKSHPELGFAAREALRTLEKYRQTHIITDKIPTSEYGSIRVELNNIHDSDLPEAFRSESNDHKILAVASNLAKTEEVTLLTKDLPLRLKSSAAGVAAEDYSPDRVENFWSGLDTVELEDILIDELYDNNYVWHNDDKAVNNTGIIVKSPHSKKSALAIQRNGTLVRVKEREIFGLRGRSAEQKIALDHLMNEQMDIVSIGGPAGTGKSILALAAGLHQTVEEGLYKKVVVFRPLYAVGGQDLGFLPGTAEEKMSPWAAAVFDALEVFCGENVIEHIIENNLLEVLPLTHIRGRTLADSFVIVDEAQNLEKMVLLTALSRMGHGSKVIMTHDIKQRDNLRVGQHDGITSIISSLAGEDIFAHITLSRSERSRVAELVSRLIDV